MENLRRIMAVDYGEARIGVAISDPLGLFARPHSIITHSRRDDALSSLQQIATKEDVGLVIIGLPTDSSGGISRQARVVIRWARHLSRVMEIPILFWDESYSSEDARAVVRDNRKARAGVGRQRKPVDDIAAAAILQDYLQARDSNHESGQSLEAFSHIE